MCYAVPGVAAGSSGGEIRLSSPAISLQGYIRPDRSFPAMELADAHVHLPEYRDPEVVVEGAKARRMLVLSCTVGSGQAELNLKLARQNPETVKCFLGVHPSEALKENGEPGGPRGMPFASCDGVGEVGLDPSYSDAGEGSAQLALFRRQLSEAERLGKPVQVHSRGAEVRCLEVLGEFNLDSVLMHWFEAKEEGSLRTVLSRGYYVSFGPALLYSGRLRRLAREIPIERLLTESDGPVSFDVLGGAGGPNTISSVVFRMAELRGMSFSETARQVAENTRRYLKP